MTKGVLFCYSLFMTKPRSLKDTFWSVAYYACIALAVIISFLVMVNAARSQTLQHHAKPPIRESDCGHRLDQIRFREWTAAKAEGLLHVRVGEHSEAVWYYRQAQYLLTDKNLEPSPAHCTEKWLDTSEAQMLILEQMYTDDVQYYKDKGLLK